MAEGQGDSEQTHPLLAAGWCQGVMFEAQGTSYDVNIRSTGDSFQRIQGRAVRSNEQLVLISHACDIKDHEENYVEALICRRHDPTKEILGRWDQNSPQYFMVDTEAAYVANARHRIKISKDTLKSLNHNGCPMDDLRQLRFVEWLTRRYDRPTISDSVYERFHVPVYAALRELEVARSADWRAFNEITNEIRVTMPLEINPPYTIGMVYLTLPEITQEQAKAITEVHRVITEAASQNVSVHDAPAVIELDEVSFGVLRRTQPLIIEYPSWEDGGVAQPPWFVDQQGDQQLPP